MGHIAIIIVFFYKVGWVVYSLSARYGFDINETFKPETRPLPIEQFKLRDSHNANKDWKLWLEEIERESRYFRINSPTDKKDALIKIAYLEKYLPELDGKLDEYQKLREKFNTYFLPRKKTSI